MALLVAERVERHGSMFGAAPEAPAPAPRRPATSDRSGRVGGLGGGLTLDDAIVGAWEGLAAHVTVACPVCDGALRPCAGEPAGGRCADCGTTLA